MFNWADQWPIRFYNDDLNMSNLLDYSIFMLIFFTTFVRPGENS